MSTRWVAMQILSIRRTAEPARINRNPKPMGVMQPGSTTEAVWFWLTQQPPGGWWTRQQIVDGTGRTGKAVDWALLFLRSTRQIECEIDDSRNARYLRYRSKR